MRSTEVIPKRSITEKEWTELLEKSSSPQGCLNNYVMDYLVKEGYLDAAKAFERESGVPISSEAHSVAHRSEIRKAIQSGEIQHAIEQLNDLYPEILEQQEGLIFHLQRQELVELIRAGNVEAALDYALDYLAPKCDEKRAYLAELEQTMALLVFDDVAKSPLHDLLDITQRQFVADEVNPAILRHQLEEVQSQLPVLLRLLLWMQRRLRGKMVFPEISDLVTADVAMAGASATGGIPAAKTQ